MNPFVWLQSLVTFRKAGGGLVVPQLDSGGRIRVNTLSGTPLVVGTTPPTETDGTEIWHNTSVGYSGLYFRDQIRNKWLSAAESQYAFGHDNADNQILRVGNVSNPQTGTAVRMPRDGTIIAVSAHAAGGALNKDFEIRVNAVNVYGFTLVSGDFGDLTLDLDVSQGDYLDVFAAAPASPVRDIVVDVFVRWRDS